MNLIHCGCDQIELQLKAFVSYKRGLAIGSLELSLSYAAENSHTKESKSSVYELQVQ